MGCRPRRRGVPLRRPVSSTPSSVRRSSALNAERAHFCACPRPARFWFPYAGMPDLVVRPAKSDLRLKIAYGCFSLRGRGPHDGGRVCACPSAVTLKAAVSRAAESDCQTDRTRRLSAVIGRRDRSGSSRPRSERRAFTVPAAVKTINNGDLDCWTSCPLGWQNERTARPGGASEGAGLSPDVSSPLIGRPMGRTRVPSGFRPRGFSRPAVAGVGRRARRAWKLKVALPGGLEPPACGLGNRRSVLMSYGSSVPGRRRGSPECSAIQLRHDSRNVGRIRAKATSPYDGDLRSLSFKSTETSDCPGRVSAALGCVPLSASTLLFERQSFQATVRSLARFNLH